MFLVSRLSLQSTPNWLSGFLKDPNTNCTQFLFMILTIRSFEVTHSGHHSFLRNLPPLLWSESVSKGKNVCRFWLEVCGKDELKKKVIKTKLSFVFGNFFLRFHTSWSPNSEELLPLQPTFGARSDRRQRNSFGLQVFSLRDYKTMHNITVRCQGKRHVC